MGGTFDPVHFGHLRPALEVATALELDEMLLMPAGQPSLRPPPRASATDRRALMELAIETAPKLRLDARELERPGPSHTYDSLVELHGQEQGAELVLCIGADAFARFTSWHRWHEIIELARLAVMPRPRAPQPSPTDLHPRLAAAWVQPHQLFDGERGRICWVETSVFDISATAIRERVARGQPIDGCTPAAVCRYIEQHSLYRPPAEAPRLYNEKILMVDASIEPLAVEPSATEPAIQALTQVALDALSELKALNVVSLDVRSTSLPADCMLIATGTSNRHVRALAEGVVRRARKGGSRAFGVEGLREARWVLVDLGDVLVHVMSEEARGFYQLEKLWSPELHDDQDGDRLQRE